MSAVKIQIRRPPGATEIQSLAREHAAEVPRLLSICRNNIAKRQTLNLTQSIVEPEDERLVPDYRAASSRSELIAAILGLTGSEEIARIEQVVPQKLVGVTVEFVSTRFCDGIDC